MLVQLMNESMRNLLKKKYVRVTIRGQIYKFDDNEGIESKGTMMIIHTPYGRAEIPEKYAEFVDTSRQIVCPKCGFITVYRYNRPIKCKNCKREV